MKPILGTHAPLYGAVVGTLTMLAASLTAQGQQSGRKVSVITGKDAMACRSQETMQRFNLIVAAGDRDAFHALLMASHRSGECRDLDGGRRVYLEEFSFRHGLARVRPEGEAETWWVLSKAVADAEPRR